MPLGLNAIAGNANGSSTWSTYSTRNASHRKAAPASNKRWLTTRSTHDAEDQQVAEHIHQSFSSFWWGLFTCYDVPGLPRTNNELERFIRQIRMGHRRVSGRKNVHDFIIRYGAYAALVDPSESLDQLLARLAEVDQEAFLQERKRLNLTLLDEAKAHRFRYHRPDYLAELEARWEAAVAQTKSQVV